MSDHPLDIAHSSYEDLLKKMNRVAMAISQSLMDGWDWMCYSK